MQQKKYTEPLIAAVTVLALFGAGGCVKPKKNIRPLSHPLPAEAPQNAKTATTDAVADARPVIAPWATFVRDGQPFCFSGANNYYLTFQSEAMVTDVLDRVVALDMDVLRTWAFIDIGSLDGAVPHADQTNEEKGAKNGVYFQYFDTETKTVKVNEGQNGLERLDYLLHAVRERGLKIILVLTNNWHDMGGMDQYLIWYGVSHHHAFFTDPQIRARFKAWIDVLAHRVNSVDGVAYKNDPAIFAWELGNELRCRNNTPFDAPDGWDETTMVTWAEEMSAYIKSQDPNHMVSFGDEGFLRHGGDHWTRTPVDGVDHEALSQVETIDFATFHLYPDDWQVDAAFGSDWIREHLAVARAIGKPLILEEYNTKVGRDSDRRITWGWDRRKTALDSWHDIMREEGGSGALVWMVAGIDDVHGLYPDYDGYHFWEGYPTADLMKAHGKRFRKEALACTMARDRLGDLPESPFVSAVRLEKQPAP